MSDAEDNYILKLLKEFRDKKLTGNIQINFRVGCVLNVNEEISTLRKDFI